MPGKSKEEPAVLDPADVIQLLVGMRKEQFEHEAAVRLFQFQAWILDSHDMTATVMAGQIAATSFLENMRPPGFYAKTNEQRYSTAALTRLFANESYRALYDTIIARYGGWTALAEISQERFDQEIGRLREQAATTAKMIDYLFRCHDHEEYVDLRRPSPPPIAAIPTNISHAMFYVFKTQRPILLGRTIRAHWQKTKRSSVFAYVSELLGFAVFPPNSGPGFLAKLTSDAKDVKRNRQFFGTCSWIADTLVADDDLFEAQADLIPQDLPKIRPSTSPLTTRELELIKNYKTEYHEMRES